MKVASNLANVCTTQYTSDEIDDGLWNVRLREWVYELNGVCVCAFFGFHPKWSHNGKLRKTK